MEYKHRDTTKVVIPDNILSEMILIYNKDKSIREVSEKFGYNKSTVYKFFKQNNVDTKMDFKKNGDRRRLFEIDHNFFEKIDTRDKAYIYGWLLSDGSMNDKTSAKQIRLKITDIEILEEIKKRIGYKQILYNANQEYYSSKETKLLVITSEKMFNDLVGHGCTPRKSLTKRFPFTIPIDIIPDFIRGYFEGNGSIYIYNNYSKHLSGEIKIVSSVFLCEGLMNYLSNNGIFSYIDHDKRCDNMVANLRIRRLKDVRLFMKLIYNDIDGQVFLKRKYNKFVELDNYRDKLDILWA